MNERIVRDVLNDDRDDAGGPTAYERSLRLCVFGALAFLAAFVGSAVAGFVVPVYYGGTGFEAGHAAGSITTGVAAALLWQYWSRVEAVLPGGEDAESE
ncbi:hypothetical protein [Candidatus Halobonum tyrrellensis]|uniref:Uncharacterized protein n=1 Tax=Candidatus Halobonum tyrrellensis G22 TaxID=1324957 RepID=V4HML5_9EURY|nr:hypothetical protein [Candidatus Halobonum tyrrellensis]ESP89169.1 hypothetical protein K933_05273 [Candidatus Halobonum tyrrellensis G22]